MPWAVAIEGSILVEQVAFGDKTTVDVAVLKVDGSLALVLDMGDFFAGSFAEFAVEDEQLAVAKDDAALEECGVLPWFAVECARHLLRD